MHLADRPRHICSCRELRESVLDNSRERSLFINDLLELQAFLLQRHVELASPDVGHLTYNALASASASVKNADAKSIRAWMDNVGLCIAKMNDPHTRLLMSIKNSPVYVDRCVAIIERCSQSACRALILLLYRVLRRVVASLEMKLDNEAKLAVAAESWVSRAAQLQDEMSIEYPRLQVSQCADSDQAD